MSSTSEPAASAVPSGMVPEAFGFARTPELVGALRRGDEAAFRWLHGQWHGRVHRYASALAAGDAALASEITQAAWLRLARGLRPVQDEAALWCWLARAARHAATDLRRTGGRYRAALRRFTEWLRPAADAEPDPDAQLLAALDRVVDQLPAADRQLLHCRYTERESLGVTAARLGCSARAVEGRLARLREKLRHDLARELLSSDRP